MSSGEPDGTQRIKAVVQYSSAELHTLIHGQIDTLTLTEEGSEDQASEWESLFEVVTLTDDAVLKETGSKSLKVVMARDPPTYVAIRFPISETVTWGTFKSISFAFHDNGEELTPQKVYFGIQTDTGQRAIKYSSGGALTTPSDSWVTWALTKGDFTIVDGGIVPASVIKYVYIILANFGEYHRNQLYVDSITVTYTGGLLPLTVDSSGNVQANLLDTSDTAIDPAKEGGNLASIKTAVEALPTNVSQETGGNLASIKTAIEKVDDLIELLKGTPATTIGAPIIPANATTTIVSIAGAKWIVGAQMSIIGTDATTRDNILPSVYVDTTLVTPYSIASITNLKVAFGLDNAIGRVRMIIYNDTLWRYALAFNFSASPIWVPAGSTFYLIMQNTHATNTYQTWGHIEHVS